MRFERWILQAVMMAAVAAPLSASAAQNGMANISCAMCGHAVQRKKPVVPANHGINVTSIFEPIGSEINSELTSATDMTANTATADSPVDEPLVKIGLPFNGTFPAPMPMDSSAWDAGWSAWNTGLANLAKNWAD